MIKSTKSQTFVSKDLEGKGMAPPFLLTHYFPFLKLWALQGWKNWLPKGYILLLGNTAEVLLTLTKVFELMSRDQKHKGVASLLAGVRTLTRGS